MAVHQFTNDQARKTLQDILSTPEFAEDNLLEWFKESIKSLFGKRDFTGSNVDMSNVENIVMGIIMLVGFILIVYLIRTIAPFWKVMVKEVRQDKATDLVYIRSTPADILLKAEHEAKRGEFRLALRDLYMSVLMDMDNHQIIVYQAAKTNNDYLREVSGQATALQEHFQSMVNLFEYKWYGLEDCTGEDFQRGRELYAALVKDGSHG